jgi:hypothetical protein
LQTYAYDEKGNLIIDPDGNPVTYQELNKVLGNENNSGPHSNSTEISPPIGIEASNQHVSREILEHQQQMGGMQHSMVASSV